MSYEHYRESKLGDSLVDALREMVEQDRISGELALKVLVEFDKSVCEALATKVPAKVNMKGSLRSYRFCDNQWQFYLKDVVCKVLASGSGTLSQAPEVRADKLVMVCMADNLLNKDDAGTGKGNNKKKKKKRARNEDDD
eukprot:CAMPEP_0177768760 /NCGR_PEP_ID=MMETSP0491_2-20121128/9910_1 /TAXON_ID=63592 /ORGANISM="Tetraselmis chuii, Strain PLY429" /LENGTH=138 /DNA_ID=CAMNT_0019285623 /DNA_START=315 /DNA_END=731 /DNA_ORIENTATION=-